jgi:NAD(P)-dependent dehydrogenase (short-subunit alcohol dehydrogenase family)
MAITIDLEGRAALVTGGASGIGRAAAARLVEAGARVVLLDRNRELAAEAATMLGAERALAITGDVTDVADAERAVAETVRAFGGIDIVVNAAGVGAVGRFWEMDPGMWDAIVAVNLRGTFVVSAAAARSMLGAGRRGRLINIASTNATVPTRGNAAYCASKAGVMAFTQVAALDLAPHGVTVNAIAPGPTDTPLTAPFFSHPESRREFLAHVPLGRLGRPEDIADAVLFLASDLASWVTGTLFYIDGGQSLVGLPPYVDLVEPRPSAAVPAWRVQRAAPGTPPAR